jgi:hypothetical protein
MNFKNDTFYIDRLFTIVTGAGAAAALAMILVFLA